MHVRRLLAQFEAGLRTAVRYLLLWALCMTFVAARLGAFLVYSAAADESSMTIASQALRVCGVVLGICITCLLLSANCEVPLLSNGGLFLS